MRNTLERRYQILELLSDRRTEKVGELAYELGVSTRTIKYDIQILSLSAPIFAVRGRYGGGIYVAGEWRMDRRYLHNDQEKLLLKLMDGLQSDDKKIPNYNCSLLNAAKLLTLFESYLFRLVTYYTS